MALTDHGTGVPRVRTVVCPPTMNRTCKWLRPNTRIGCRSPNMATAKTTRWSYSRSWPLRLPQGRTHTHDTNFLRAQELPYQIQLISRTCLTKISFDKALNSSSVAPAGASTAVAAKRRHLGRRGTFLSDELSVYIVFGGLRQAVCYAPLVVTKSLV